ncbi:hypothetical protein N0V82_009570 [Gnomoniopsis sp. IMI 355080]|nr:hypothetical protein N0V82_009570 [Gnomoniopsis sp. IMI 355080]
MDTLKKVLHPTSHATDSSSSAHTHPNAETQAALGDQPNVTGTDRHHQPPPPSSEIHHEVHDEHKKPRAGHHHPRQPVGATGLPPNHKPRSDFVDDNSGQQQHQHQHQHQQPPAAVGVTGAEAGLEGGDTHRMGKVVAESGNNFPGTNPHPAHSALGNKDAEGAQGTLNPGRE